MLNIDHRSHDYYPVLKMLYYAILYYKIVDLDYELIFNTFNGTVDFSSFVHMIASALCTCVGVCQSAIVFTYVYEELK